MSVELHDETTSTLNGFVGYRVRRCVDGKSRQAYFSLRTADSSDYVDAKVEAQIGVNSRNGKNRTLSVS